MPEMVSPYHSFPVVFPICPTISLSDNLLNRVVNLNEGGKMYKLTQVQTYIFISIYGEILSSFYLYTTCRIKCTYLYSKAIYDTIVYSFNVGKNEEVPPKCTSIAQ